MMHGQKNIKLIPHQVKLHEDGTQHKNGHSVSRYTLKLLYLMRGCIVYCNHISTTVSSLPRLSWYWQGM